MTEEQRHIDTIALGLLHAYIAAEYAGEQADFDVLDRWQEYREVLSKRLGVRLYEEQR
jgi:hypothetical protein